MYVRTDTPQSCNLSGQLIHTKVAVITIPSLPQRNLLEIQKFVRDSLVMGILVKEQGIEFEIVDVPDLGGVIVHEVPNAPDIPCAVPDTRGTEVNFSGHGAKEKRRIYEKLMQYRTEHGLGCLDELAAVIGGGVTTETLRDAINGTKLTMDIWRQIGIAMDRLSTEKFHNKTG